MHEARIGSLPWFAGIFWFLLGGAFYLSAWGVMYLRDGASWLILKLSSVTAWCMEQATKCAKEAGGEE
jgi:hypothetical protein